MDQDKALRQQLGKILDWGEAHTDLASAIADLPAKLRGEVPEGMPHSAWQLVEHIRLTLWDILEFSRNPSYKSPPWPEGYWPKEPAPPDTHAWEHSVKAIKENNILKMYVDENVLSFMNTREYETSLTDNETIEASVAFIDKHPQLEDSPNKNNKEHELQLNSIIII